eukprot:sb/3469448/
MGVIESISRSYPLNRSSSRHIRPEPRHDLQTGVTPSQTVPITLQPALETLPITTKTQLRWLFNFDIIGCGIVNEKPGKLGGNKVSIIETVNTTLSHSYTNRVQVVHDMFLVCELTRAEALSADETDCVTWQSVTEGNHSWAVERRFSGLGNWYCSSLFCGPHWWLKLIHSLGGVVIQVPLSSNYATQKQPIGQLIDSERRFSGLGNWYCSSLFCGHVIRRNRPVLSFLK